MLLANSCSMNTAPVIQISVQPSVGPSTAAGSDNTAQAGGAHSNFAGALNAAGAKPSRRAGASKQSDDGGSGGSLPPAGNQSPPVPQAAARGVAKPHANHSSAADRPRVERARASDSAPAENPLAGQAAAGAAARIEGAKAPSGPSRQGADSKAIAAGPAGAANAAAGAATAAAASAAEVASTDAAAAAAADAAANGAAIAAKGAATDAVAVSTAKAATNGATKNAAGFDAAGERSAMGARIESGLAAKSAAAAVQASAVVAADAAAAAKLKVPAPIASPSSNSALASDSTAAPDFATDPDAATSANPSAKADSAQATSAPPASPEQATLAAASASAAADKAAPKPHAAALRPVSKGTGQTIAPATNSGTAPAGGEADSTFRAVSDPASDTSPAGGGAKVPTPTLDTGAQDAAATAAAIAAVVSTPQSANKARVDNSHDFDASVGALGAGTEAAGASAPLVRSEMRAAAGPLLAQDAANAANAPTAADAGKHAHAGFDLAALAGSGGDAAAGLSQLNANASVGAPADATPAPALRVHANVDSADFPQGLSDRVSWMVDNGVNGAKLQVNPPQLGPIELRISVQGDHAQVWMTTHSAVARDALELSSPKLREMLNAQGFGQVSVDISQRSFQDRSAYVPPYQRESADVRGAAVRAAAPTAAASAPRSLPGALDAYA